MMLHILPCYVEVEILAGIGGLITTAYVFRAYVRSFLDTRKGRR